MLGMDGSVVQAMALDVLLRGCLSLRRLSTSTASGGAIRAAVESHVQGERFDRQRQREGRPPLAMNASEGRPLIARCACWEKRQAKG